MGPLYLIAMIAVACLIAWLGHRWETRSGERETVVAEVESAERTVRRHLEIEAARFRPASRIPERPHALRASVLPELLDEAEVAADADLLIAAAIVMCRASAEQFANLALMDEYATKYPMKQRPRLVERAEPNLNPLGGES